MNYISLVVNIMFTRENTYEYGNDSFGSFNLFGLNLLASVVTVANRLRYCLMWNVIHSSLFKMGCESFFLRLNETIWF